MEYVVSKSLVATVVHIQWTSTSSSSVVIRATGCAGAPANVVIDVDTGSALCVVAVEWQVVASGTCG